MAGGGRRVRLLASLPRRPVVDVDAVLDDAPLFLKFRPALCRQVPSLHGPFRGGHRCPDVLMPFVAPVADLNAADLGEDPDAPWTRLRAQQDGGILAAVVVIQIPARVLADSTDLKRDPARRRGDAPVSNASRVGDAQVEPGRIFAPVPAFPLLR